MSRNILSRGLKLVNIFRAKLIKKPISLSGVDLLPKMNKISPQVGNISFGIFVSSIMLGYTYFLYQWIWDDEIIIQNDNSFRGKDPITSLTAQIPDKKLPDS